MRLHVIPIILALYSENQRIYNNHNELIPDRKWNQSRVESSEPIVSKIPFLSKYRGFLPVEQEFLPVCVRVRGWGIQGFGQPLSRVLRDASHPPRSAHSSFCSAPLALSTTDPVCHESRNPARHLSPSATNSCTRTTNREAAATVKYLHALNRARYSGHSIIWNKSRPFPSIEGNSDRNLFQVLKKFWKMDRLCSLCLSKWAHVCKWAVERRRKVKVLIIFLKPLLKIISNRCNWNYQGTEKLLAKNFFFFLYASNLSNLSKKIQVLELDPIFLPLASLLPVFERCKQETCTDSII